MKNIGYTNFITSLTVIVKIIFQIQKDRREVCLFKRAEGGYGMEKSWQGVKENDKGERGDSGQKLFVENQIICVNLMNKCLKRLIQIKPKQNTVLI